MTTEGVDYSYGRPGGAALVAAGKSFAFRYVPYPGNGGKGLTTAELGDLQSHGLSVGLVFESTKGRALGGRPAGVSDATMTAAAITPLGFPADRPVYFAVDFDAQATQQAAIDAYLGGAASVLSPSRVGVYGGLDVVNRCAENGSAQWFWQTYAWSGGRQSAHAHLYQYHNGQTINGAAVDFDRSITSDFGQWVPLPDSSTGDTMIQVIPSAPGGATVTSASADIYTLDGQHQKVPLTQFPADAISYSINRDDNAAPKGGPWYRLAAKPYAGWYVPAASVTFTGPPPPVADCTDAVAAQREKDRTASLAAIEGVFA